MGRLKSPSGDAEPPSVLEATRYLPSLHNTVWESSEEISDVVAAEQAPLDKSYQLAIRRARLGVEILKRPSDDQTKFDLFQRLNAGGTQANPQELRNCIMLMINGEYFRHIKVAAERVSFKSAFSITEDQFDRQRHMEYAVRFLVHAEIAYDGKLDVEEYIDEGIVQLAKVGNASRDARLLDRTFDLLDSISGSNTLRRYDGDRHTGKVGLVALEGIAVGVASNIDSILLLPDPESFVKQRILNFWEQPETATFTSPGLRGTTRIQRTVPFGKRWFKP